MTMEMSVYIDNQPFKVIYNQRGRKQPFLCLCLLM